MTWIVGRAGMGCFVEELDKPVDGTEPFTTEAEALRYAIMCDVDVIEPLRANLRAMRRRLAKIERTTSPTRSVETREDRV